MDVTWNHRGNSYGLWFKSQGSRSSLMELDMVAIKRSI
jgi:hypothetical protein